MSATCASPSCSRQMYKAAAVKTIEDGVANTPADLCRCRRRLLLCAAFIVAAAVVVVVVLFFYYCQLFVCSSCYFQNFLAHYFNDILHAPFSVICYFIFLCYKNKKKQNISLLKCEQIFFVCTFSNFALCFNRVVWVSRLLFMPSHR